jgi:fused signal recognition particle receptor
MFKFLKDKISKWTKNLTEDADEIIAPIEKVEKLKEKNSKKTNKKKISKKKPDKKNLLKEKKAKEIELPQKFSSAEQKYEPDLEKIEETIEQETEKEEEIQKTEEKKSFFSKLTSSISKAKISEEKFEQYSEDLEMLLLENNVALEVAEKIISELKEKIVGKEIPKKELEQEIKNSLEEVIREILIEPPKIENLIHENLESPFVILFCGVNGTGKTTSIAKIAKYLEKQNIKSVMAAGDTFRAAAIQQLQEHGEKLNIPVIARNYGADPASVGFDAIQYAKKHKIPCVLIDTAGRMHTAKNLLAEIGKVARVCKPNLKFFVGESITGNDAVEQVKAFNEEVQLDGVVLTKADIDEKGGTALSLGYITKKPIFFLGTGQEYSDIEQFNKNKFLEKLGL